MWLFYFIDSYEYLKQEGRTSYGSEIPRISFDSAQRPQRLGHHPRDDRITQKTGRRLRPATCTPRHAVI